jgi:hypothetical protein
MHVKSDVRPPNLYPSSWWFDRGHSSDEVTKFMYKSLETHTEFGVKNIESLHQKQSNNNSQ